jgi:hypothetical protein
LQYLTIGLTFVVAILLQIYFRQLISVGVILLLSLLGIALVIIPWSVSDKVKAIFYQSCLFGIGLGFYLNLAFYPVLLTYQSGTQAALYLNKHYPKTTTSTFLDNGDVTDMDFYLEQPLLWLNEEQIRQTVSKQNLMLLTTEANFKSLGLKNSYRELKSFPHFHITTLNGEFINHITREKALDKRKLIFIYAER